MPSATKILDVVRADRKHTAERCILNEGSQKLSPAQHKSILE